MILKSLFRVLFFIVVAVSVLSLGTASANDLSPKEKLGKKLFFDNISDPDWISVVIYNRYQMVW